MFNIINFVTSNLTLAVYDLRSYQLKPDGMNFERVNFGNL